MCANRLDRANRVKLPNGSRAIVELAKLRDYCLNANHEEGKHKARVFAAALGIRAADAAWLKDRLTEAAAREDAALVAETAFGRVYVLDFELETMRGGAEIRSGWIVRSHEGFPRLTTCYVRKSK